MLNPEYPGSPDVESILKIRTIDGSRNQRTFDDGFAITKNGISLAVVNPLRKVPYNSPDWRRIFINLENRYLKDRNGEKRTHFMFLPETVDLISLKQGSCRDVVIVHLDRHSKYRESFVSEEIVFVEQNREFSEFPNLSELYTANRAAQKRLKKSVLKFPSHNSGKCTEKMVNFFNATFDEVCREIVLAKNLPLLGRDSSEMVCVTFEKNIRCSFHRPARCGLDCFNMASLLHAINPTQYPLPQEDEYYSIADRYNDLYL